MDYGNTAVIADNCVRKLVPDFLHTPLQAVECSLNGVELEESLQENNLIRYNELRYVVDFDSYLFIFLFVFVAFFTQNEGFNY